jgi:outer membrane protein TolC
VPSSLQSARLKARLAQIGIRNARRSVYPVAQASYTWNLDDHNSVGVSLESRTLQPKVDYSYQEPGRSFPQNEINGTFQIGVSVAISPGVFQGLAATDAQLRAAQDGVDAAERAAAIQRASLDNDLAQAQAQLALGQRKLADAEATLREAQTRERLGLDIPLTTQRAALDRTQRALDLRQAQRDVLAKTLAYYTFFSRPLTEVPQ